MRRKSFTIVASCFLAAGTMLSGCTTTPVLDTIDGAPKAEDGSISIREVVKRVKCELYGATRDIHRDYWWFRTWGAKIDLDLVVNEQAGVTPSVSFIDPLHTGTFTLGFNGGVTTTANRSESVSFSTTFLELDDELGKLPANKHLKYDDCKLPQGSELNSDLGLKEWVTSAIGPATGGNSALLHWGGTVQASGGGGKKTSKSTRPPESIAATKCKWTPGSPPLKDTNCRPPIDSVTHTVEFTIVASAGISPNWVFKNFKGPTGSGSLASTSRTGTHRLTITLGPSAEARSDASGNTSLRLLAPSLTNAINQPH